MNSIKACIPAIFLTLLVTERAYAGEPRHLERLVIDQASGIFVPAFSSADLDEPRNPKHLVVSIHGAGHSADGAYRNLAKLIEEEGIKDCLLIAPQFNSTEGFGAIPYIPYLVTWRNGWWRYGSRSSTYVDDSGEFHRAGISTFEVLDRTVESFISRDGSQLESVVFFGFSAGGQLIQRYALYGSQPDRPANSKVDFVYFASSPSSYMYLNPLRPKFSQDGKIQGFLLPESPVQGYDDFQYGMANIDGKNKNGGSICSYFSDSGLTKDSVRERYRTRKVFYVVGDQDEQQSKFDDGGEAMLQGSSRVQRARAFFAHVQDYYDKPVNHSLVVVKGAEHDSGAILSDQKLRESLLGATP